MLSVATAFVVGAGFGFACFIAIRRSQLNFTGYERWRREWPLPVDLLSEIATRSIIFVLVSVGFAPVDVAFAPWLDGFVLKTLKKALKC